jgi:hypothetical protein
MSIYTTFISNQFCVYHTTYSGNLMPQNYIGSTSVDNILNKNYHGSVTSKRYKDIWKSELNLHSELFSTVIVSYHDTRSNATHKELQIQRLFNVVKSEIFINRAYASVNGFSDTLFTPEERASAKIKELNTKLNKTLEEKLSSSKKQSNTMANKTSEQKSITGKKKSDAFFANRVPFLSIIETKKSYMKQHISYWFPEFKCYY